MLGEVFYAFQHVSGREAWDLVQYFADRARACGVTPLIPEAYLASKAAAPRIDRWTETTGPHGGPALVYRTTEGASYMTLDPTFADALALVRRQLWTEATFHTLPTESDLVNIPRPLLNHLADLLCYAA